MKALEYAGTEGLSYRGAWELGPGKPICCGSNEDGDIDDRRPSPAFLWNWVGRVGRWIDRMLEAAALIKEKEPECDVYRRLKPVDPNKYRSDNRKKLLEVVLRLWLIRIDFTRIYPALKYLFPRLLNGISEKPD